MDDQPRAPRRRVFKGSKITFNDRSSVIDCLVRDKSDAGARLHLPSTTGVPDEFELEDGKERRRCRVVWRSLTEIGVAFV
jgi:hypothetical protein